MTTKSKNEVVINMAEEVHFTTEKDYIEDIVSRIEKKKIYIDPRYQRRNSWNKENQLSFIIDYFFILLLIFPANIFT